MQSVVNITIGVGEGEEEGEGQEVQHRGEDHGLQHRDGQEEG